MSLAEDRGQVRTGQAAHVPASLNNAVIGLAAHVGEPNLAAAQRGFAYRFDRAMHYSNCQQQFGAPAVPEATPPPRPPALRSLPEQRIARAA